MTTPHILLVEDDTDTQNMLGIILNHYGYQLSIQDSAQKAISFLRGTTPDAILLDIRLPDMDGSELLTKLKKDPSTMTIPVVAITAFYTSETAADMRERGFDSYLPKPLNGEQIVSTLKRLLVAH